MTFFFLTTILRKMFRIFLTVLFSIVFILSLSLKNTVAQEADFGVAQLLPIIDKKVSAGDIVSSTNKGFTLSRKPYDQAIVGVVSAKPAISFDVNETGSNVKRYYVVTTGTVAVKVSTINGVIKKGDLISSSAIPGVGMLASKTGFVLGASLENFSAKKPEEVGLVNLVLNLRASSSQAGIKSRLIDVSNLSALALLEEPLTALRYLIAGLVVVFSIVLGFYAFGRVAGRGVEALGRNPLAARIIQLGVALNVLITIAIIGAGILIAILILTI